jgi:hypothetical protein
MSDIALIECSVEKTNVWLSELSEEPRTVLAG